MNFGLRAILLVAAVVCFIIAIFTDLHQGDWIAIGLACYTGSVLVGELGWERSFNMGARRST
jgi:sorbitol-specific phosphotransferase system component IIBC